MSNLIPYFVLAVVALGFFAVCYAVFSGGDGESKAKEKSYKNLSDENSPKEYNDALFATESKKGDVTITHAGGTNVYTASIPDTVETKVSEESEIAEPLVAPTDTSYNRRSTLKSRSHHASTGYALALDPSHEVRAEDENKTSENNVANFTDADSNYDETVELETASVDSNTPESASIMDETIVMTAVSDYKHTNQGVAPLVDKTIVLDVVTDELLNGDNSVEDTIAMENLRKLLNLMKWTAWKLHK